ncbi:uncharacterized protein C14orf132 [Phyllopteryx taeniolatus]|uniref:uncharacterized protein C14orf132 n=1 Tax=Phyllopteryx taeniolatus TaxID=161469 RepID=UPI002AD29CC9|nr:uncharacterized protein C14orf132 [Phyllopteryx taeniolatus]XP_061638895.1 uncharacterized protein C14orf132 [Phyllopteryx taeniolatus]XP_061638896.1 uncharacterized protein C14orf132 [Phyllopteryx taeniolatus]
MMELSLMAAQKYPPVKDLSDISNPNQHFPAVSGAFMDSPYNGNTSLQTSTSNLNTGYSRPSETEDDGKVSSDTIWLWIAVLATIGNIVVVAVVCACAF